MTDALSLAVDLVQALIWRVEDVKTNRDGCKLLALLAEQTLDILQALSKKKFDSAVAKALELVNDALIEAREVVDKCCNTSFIIAMLYHGSYASSLKQALKKLEHALSQIPLASLGTTADIYSAVDALSFKVHNARFEESAQIEDQTKTLKDAFERAFNRSGQGIEEVKNLIQELLQQHSSSKEEGENELEVLKEYAYEAKKNKDKQIEFELDQIIGVLSQSLIDVNVAPRVVDDFEDCLRCPISKEIMKDPVVLKDSGMTYDRSSIEEWIRRGHRHDPLTNIEFASSELVPNRIIQNACQTLLEQYGGSSSIPKDSCKDSAESQLTLGLYEGHGKLTIGSSIIHVLQLLIVEPHGKVHGYTLYKREDLILEESVLEIGEGEWNGTTNELSFGDNKYSYNGIINFGAGYLQSELNWSGQVSKATSQDKEHVFALTYSPPPIQRSIALHPTILQMEGALEATGSKEKYNSKIVLSLEVDSTIGGWIWFESIDHGSRFVGRVINGRWDYDGTLSFPVYFLDQDIPLNSDIAPTNHSAVFKVLGNVRQDERASHSKFTAIATRARNEGARRSNVQANVPLDDIPILEYSFLRESSTPWYHLHPNPLKIFNMFRTYELRNVDYSVKANFDLSYGSFSHYLRTWGRTPLHIASWNNSIGIVKKLIASGVDVDEKDNIGQSPLHHAASNNSFDVIKELIVRGATMNIKDDSGKTPLCIACEKNNMNIFKELITRGASIDVQDDKGWSLLHHATNNDSIDVVRELIAQGAIVDIKDNFGKTPSHIACEKNHICIFEELVKHGANFVVQDDNGWSLLHHATYNNSVDVIKALLEKGANVNILDAHGKTPLYIAFNKNFRDVIKELLDNGANIDLQDDNGWSQLHHAIYNGNIDVVKGLSSNGAKFDILDKCGKSPLYIAFDRNSTNIIKELLDNGANIDLQDEDGWTLLHHSTKNNDFDIVKKLISEGASIDLQDNVGRTPLYLASQEGHTEVVKKLIVNGGKVNIQNNNGESPLYIASRNGHTEVVKELIVNGANVNLQRSDGISPLYTASAHGHIDVVKELIVNGADVNLQNKNGCAPLYIASQNNHIDIVKELIVNSADVNLQKNGGASPLYVASQESHVDVVKELMVNGADVNLQRDNGCSPLYVASQKGHVDVVKELMVNGADVNLQRDNGCSPLYVASQNNHIEVVKELIANGADVDLQANGGYSSVYVASQNGHTDVVKELIVNGANVNLQAIVGWTPLHIASSCGRVSIVKVLLENGASKEIGNNQGQTPYDVACTSERFKPYEASIERELKALLKP